mgnify:CR=1 FL=1
MTPMLGDMARKLGAAAPPIPWLHCAYDRRRSLVRLCFVQARPL